MKGPTSQFVCSQCGYTSSKWLGRCPDCGSWNSFTEEKIEDRKAVSKDSSQYSSTALSDVPYETEFRFESGISELDRVLGGGIVRASSILVGGEPGIGKSTLLLQVVACCSSRRKVLYVSGEESASQVRQRAERLGLNLGSINIFCETKLDRILSVLKSEKPQIAVIDSLQTLASEELTSTAGSVTQIRNCCMEIVGLCKAIGVSVFFVGHVTKEGALAGPKIIEHMVDTVLYFEQASMGVRLIRAAKNRFGSVDEIGIFVMTNEGLEGVKDPASFFISERKESELPPGIAYTAITEGTRTFLVELQALIVDAKSGYSRVYSDKIDSSRVMRVCAILERHAGIRLADKDIYINVAGGIKVNEVSVELALAMAIWSAYSEKNLPAKMVSFGELSLAGEVRPVNYGDRRLKAAYEMGFDKALVPASMNFEPNRVLLKRCQRVRDAFNIR
ncbi:MAG TPA: DNA repair protein RadA [Sphaerochaeta sp.]|nr:DNA repair protein RadA [Sphaerochaeta sp.]